jgi:nicotinate-nucleotide adenylyltransferase
MFSFLRRLLPATFHIPIFSPEPKLKRIGLSMGTFNPIHLFHLQAAQCAWDQFKLDFVLFIPNGNPPHKTGVLDKVWRYRMVKAGIRRIPHFRCSRIETDREGLSYTYLTLRELKLQYGEDVELCLIIGLDNAEPITKWDEADEIFRLCRLLVAPRSSETFKRQENESDEDFMLRLRELIATVLPAGAKFDVIDCPESNVSSSTIRRWIATGRAASAYFLVPNAVRRIIQRRKFFLQPDLQKAA